MFLISSLPPTPRRTALFRGLVAAAMLTVLPIAGGSVALAAPDGAELFPSTGANDPITPERKRAVLNAVIEQMRTGYAVEAMGEKMAQAIERKRDAGGYESVKGVIDLAKVLTTDLRAVSNDLHLKVIYMGAGPVGSGGPPPPIKDGETPKDVIFGNPARSNFEYHEAKWLPGNVGYLRVPSFAAPAALSETARASAMAFLGNTEAMIIDLRDNTGGAGDNPARLMSYFFDKPTKVGEMRWRSNGRVDEIWTQDMGAAAYGQSKPVYILANKKTFSSGESIVYNMQGLGRAKMVGETTGGGAHPTLMSPVDEQFATLLPSGYSVHEVTKRDWEVTGVKPDIATSSSKAFDAAYHAALRDLLATAESPERRAELEAVLRSASGKGGK